MSQVGGGARTSMVKGVLGSVANVRNVDGNETDGDMRMWWVDDEIFDRCARALDPSERDLHRAPVESERSRSEDLPCRDAFGGCLTLSDAGDDGDDLLVRSSVC